MPFSLTLHEEDALLLGHGWGTVRPEEVLSAIDRVGDDPRYRPHFDRITWIEAEALLSDLTPQALTAIRDAIRRIENAALAAGERMRFRSAIVTTNPMAEVLASFYRATWAAWPDDHVEMRTFAGWAEAAAWLDRPALARPRSGPMVVVTG